MYSPELFIATFQMCGAKAGEVEESLCRTQHNPSDLAGRRSDSGASKSRMIYNSWLAARQAPLDPRRRGPLQRRPHEACGRADEPARRTPRQRHGAADRARAPARDSRIPQRSCRPTRATRCCATSASRSDSIERLDDDKRKEKRILVDKVRKNLSIILDYEKNGER